MLNPVKLEEDNDELTDPHGEDSELGEKAESSKKENKRKDNVTDANEVEKDKEDEDEEDEDEETKKKRKIMNLLKDSWNDNRGQSRWRQHDRTMRFKKQRETNMIERFKKQRENNNVD